MVRTCRDGGSRYVERSIRRITQLGLQNCSVRILTAHTIQPYSLLTSRANSYFIYFMGEMIKEKSERLASGSTFFEISGNMLSQYGIPVSL